MGANHGGKGDKSKNLERGTLMQIVVQVEDDRGVGVGSEYVPLPQKKNEFFAWNGVLVLEILKRDRTGGTICICVANANCPPSSVTFQNFKHQNAISSEKFIFSGGGVPPSTHPLLVFKQALWMRPCVPQNSIQNYVYVRMKVSLNTVSIYGHSEQHLRYLMSIRTKQIQLAGHRVFSVC